MTYVYIQSEPGLWTAGFYNGKEWTPESDHSSTEEAAARVHYLNGGVHPETKSDLTQLCQERADILEIGRALRKETVTLRQDKAELLEAIERTAADRAYAAEMGVGEWEAFLKPHEAAAIAKATKLI